jgi:lipopolysaccharide/colanic/teichoic acid biosynthesis glycosyltransferase
MQHYLRTSSAPSDGVLLDAGSTAAILNGPWMATWLLDDLPSSSWAWSAKRVLDVAVATVLLVLLGPLLLLAALLVRLTSPGPALFRQRRVGYDGQPFTIFKLRTMVQHPQAAEAAPPQASSDALFIKAPNDPRITPVGRVLRRTSIDELPQLINVLRGDMSLVGPRPLSPAEAERLLWRRDRARFAVPPGLTGLWQVSGRSLCSEDERRRLDTRYAEEWSLRLDLSILARTVPAVVTGHGAV